MQLTATDVGVSAWMLVTTVSSAKTAELIYMPFWMKCGDRGVEVADSHCPKTNY